MVVDSVPCRRAAGWERLAAEVAVDDINQCLGKESAAAWDKYRESQCQAAFDQYKGGTIVPSQAGSCELLLRRSRMRELHGIYRFLLVN